MWKFIAKTCVAGFNGQNNRRWKESIAIIVSWMADKIQSVAHMSFNRFLQGGIFYPTPIVIGNCHLHLSLQRHLTVFHSSRLEEHLSTGKIVSLQNFQFLNSCFQVGPNLNHLKTADLYYGPGMDLYGLGGTIRQILGNWLRPQLRSNWLNPTTYHCQHIHRPKIIVAITQL